MHGETKIGRRRGKSKNYRGWRMRKWKIIKIRFEEGQEEKEENRKKKRKGIEKLRKLRRRIGKEDMKITEKEVNRMEMGIGW